MKTGNATRISLPWYKVWFDSLARPSVASYGYLLQDIHASPKLAYFWLVIGGLIGGIVSAFAQPPQRGTSPIILAVCGAPFLAILVVITITVVAGLIQWLARSMGGIGTYSKLVYALATFNAPMTIISSLLLLVPYGLWINAAAGIYWAVFSVIAVKAVHQLETRNAIIAALPVILLTILLIAVTPWAVTLMAHLG